MHVFLDQQSGGTSKQCVEAFNQQPYRVGFKQGRPLRTALPPLPHSPSPLPALRPRGVDALPRRIAGAARPPTTTRSRRYRAGSAPTEEAASRPRPQPPALKLPAPEPPAPRPRAEPAAGPRRAPPSRSRRGAGTAPVQRPPER